MTRFRLPSPSRALIAAAAVALLTAWLATGTTRSGWTVSTLANDTDTAMTGAVAMSVGYQSATCAAGPRVSSVTCSGSLAPGSSPPASASSTISNTGNLASSKLTETLSAASCAPARLDNAKTAADPMLPRYLPSFQQADPWGSTSAISLGSGSYAADVASTSTGSSLGTSFSLGLWFRVPSGYSGGGGLLSLAASPASSSSAASSPAVWMDGSGKIRYYLAGTLGTSTAGVSAAAYNDGQWHLAVLSVGLVTVLATPTLYVDGNSAVGLGLAALTSGSGYWHVGWADFTSISNAPGTASLGGSLSGAFVSGSSMTSGTVASLAGSTSASDYQTKVLALSGTTHLWMLGDSGASTYSGTLPPSMTSPCGQVEVTFTLTSPSGTVAAQSLTSLVTSPATVTAPGSGGTQDLAVATTKAGIYNQDIAGLRLVVPLTITHSTLPGDRWPLAVTWSTATGVFLG